MCVCVCVCVCVYSKHQYSIRNMIKIVHEKFRISIQFLIFKEFLFSDFNADFLFYTENHCPGYLSSATRPSLPKKHYNGLMID